MNNNKDNDSTVFLCEETLSLLCRCDRVLARGATSEYRFKIGYFALMGAGWHKISGRRGCPHQPFFFSEN